MDEHPAHDERWLELLSAHADDELDAAEAALVDDHLASCASCRMLDDRFAADRRRARMGAPRRHDDLGARILAATDPVAVPAASAPGDRTGMALGLRLAAAAAVAVALGLGVLLTTDDPGPDTAAALAERAILLDDDRSPLADGDVTVTEGTTVRLRNSGTETHHLEVELTDGVEAADVVPGAADTVTYDETGTYTYRCTIHPEVAGTVTVEEA